ncbi:TetR/AcrR family transcriptional regulator [Paenibacillus thermotolerans]|uniref:TetR/AcrR family transcriptional regulator n=1 Tax=Paenibacillus thermotolerans TaxID=3027807 RepID=UPI0023684722|nr:MULTISPECIES: TetR/AcrR family transcriptional regulator [unclassified Paenibacillus]
MPKKFSDQEKERIHAKLIETGKKLFASLGLQKTSVADLTKPIGIAQGSFYLFYDSKESLYMEIVAMEEEKVRTTVFERYLSEGPMTRSRFAVFLRESIRCIEESPILQQLYDERIVEALFRKLPPEAIEEHFTEDAGALEPFLARGRSEGWLADKDPEAVVSLIRSLVLFALQKQRIGEKHYEATIQLLIECIAQGLIVERGSSE